MKLLTVVTPVFCIALMGDHPFREIKTYRNPIEIHGNIATTIKPTSSASR